jgi:hypothetical protein
MILLVLVGSMIAADDDREKVPDAKEQEKALAVIKDLFKEDFAKKKPADLVELSDKLFKQAQETKDDAASRYILFRESMNLAAQAGDLERVMNVVEELSKGFQINAPEMKAGLFERAVPAAKTADAARGLTEDILQTIKEAVANDDFDTADRLVKIAETAAKKAKVVALTSEITARGKEAARLRGEFAKVKEALTTLEKKPTDPEANGIAGQYFCLAKGNWEKGLPMLVQAKDEKMKALAEKDVANPDTPQAQMEMADAWFDLAAGKDLDAAYKPYTQLRALYWYEQCVGGLTGLTKTKVEKRMADLEKVAEKYRDNSELFIALREAIKAKKTKNSGVTGGGRKEFAEVPAEGGLLIGFNYTLGNFVGQPVMGWMQPIFLTARGEKLGTAYGKIDPKAKVMQVKAKKGYAVGAMTVRGGGGLDAIEMTFMKIDKNGLNKADSYQSEHIGGKGGGEGKHGGDGSFVVGIQGRIEDDTKINGLGIVMLPLKDEKK